MEESVAGFRELEGGVVHIIVDAGRGQSAAGRNRGCRRGAGGRHGSGAGGRRRGAGGARGRRPGRACRCALRRLAGFIPSGASVEEGEAHARDRRAFEADRTRGHLETNPLARGGQRADEMAASGAIGAVVDRVAAPVSAVLPTVGVPREHQFAGWIGGVEVDVGEERLASDDGQRCAGIVEEMLVEA